MQAEKQGQKVAHCHIYVRKIAKELAGATYSRLMEDNLIYSTWKKAHPDLAGSPKKLEAAFIEKNWGLHVHAARTTLTLLLRSPTLTEEEKEKIMDVLLKDSTLMRGRRDPATVAQVLTQNNN